MPIRILYDDIPTVTIAQMEAADRAMVEDYHIDLIQMMESAGRQLAHLARDRFLDADPRGKAVAVLAGTGGNGGGALVAARRLAGWGARVEVALTRAAMAFSGVPARQLAIVERLGLPLRVAGAPGRVDLVLDGLVGYHLVGAPRERLAELIRWANALDTPVLALDVPSGMDADTGEQSVPTMRADATMTLALPKAGLLDAGGQAPVGELYLADIGIPPALWAGAGIGVDVGPLFAKSEIIRLR